MAQDSLQQNILIALQGIQTALGQRNNTSLLLFRSDTQDPIEWLDDFERAATANQYDNKYKIDLSYALWPLLVLKNNPTMDMTIELAQRIEDNQKMHLGSTLTVFVPALVITPVPQITATSFAAQTQDLNEQLIDRLTANLVQLLKPLA
ncbi:hypothetical protein G9A89_013677 [Geosiphon pyriformis]|nr:hypothetical protein G9A89_013677 [Geosiphon pyriformis]